MEAETYKQHNMRFKTSDIITAVLFVPLLVATGLAQSELKDEAQVYMLLFGLITLAALYAKPPFKTRIPFNMLLGIMCYIAIFILTLLIVDILAPNNGTVVNSAGEKHPVMKMNWVWGVLGGIVLSPFIVAWYHYKAPKNKALEVLLTLAFILITATIYVLNR